MLSRFFLSRSNVFANNYLYDGILWSDWTIKVGLNSGGNVRGGKVHELCHWMKIAKAWKSRNLKVIQMESKFYFHIQESLTNFPLLCLMSFGINVNILLSTTIYWPKRDSSKLLPQTGFNWTHFWNAINLFIKQSRQSIEVCIVLWITDTWTQNWWDLNLFKKS